MKKLLKPEMEFIKFNTEDVITTSGENPVGGGDTYNTGTNQYGDTTNDAKESKDFGGLDWNIPIQ